MLLRRAQLQGRPVLTWQEGAAPACANRPRTRICDAARYRIKNNKPAATEQTRSHRRCLFFGTKSGARRALAAAMMDALLAALRPLLAAALVALLARWSARAIEETPELRCQPTDANRARPADLAAHACSSYLACARACVPGCAEAAPPRARFPARLRFPSVPMPQPAPLQALPLGTRLHGADRLRVRASGRAACRSRLSTCSRRRPDNSCLPLRQLRAASRAARGVPSRGAAYA